MKHLVTKEFPGKIFALGQMILPMNRWDREFSEVML